MDRLIGRDRTRAVLGLLMVLLAGVVLVSLSGSGRTVAAAAEDWGELRDGLRTRLVTDRTTWTIGQDITVRLELRNETKEALGFDPPQRVICPGGLVIKRDGRLVRYIAGDFQTGAGRREIAPGKTEALETIRLSEYWSFHAPGRYTIQFPETKTFQSVLPASNVLGLTVTLPPDGKLPPIDLQQTAHFYTAPPGWSVPDFEGLVFNYQRGPEPFGGERLDGIFSVVQPDEPFPVYEGRCTALAIRMPVCRASTHFEARHATLNDSTLRLTVVRSPGAGPGGRVRPYLLFDLGRLLAAGQYECRLQLLGPGDREAEPSAYRFAFTVLPPR